MSRKVKPIPEGYHTISPMLVLRDARKAIEFYKKAFDAKELFAMPGPNGRGVAHAELIIGDSKFMLSDENPQQHTKGVESIGASPVSFYLYVQNVDAFFKKAVGAGAKSEMPVQDMFWGDRAGTLKDPFGFTWMIATHKKDLSTEEIKKGAEAAYALKK